MPIDASNFDDAAVTTAVPYTGAPANAGQVDGIIVTGLYIETNYYFAVRAVDVAGSLSPIIASASGTSRPFSNDSSHRFRNGRNRAGHRWIRGLWNLELVGIRR